MEAWCRCGGGGEYVQNALYETLKDLMQILAKIMILASSLGHMTYRATYFLAPIMVSSMGFIS